MKLKALMVAVFVAGLTASFALADDGGHGKRNANTASTATTTTGKKTGPAACRPRIELEVAGTVASSSGSSLAVLVSKGGAQGAQLKGKQLTFDLTGAKVRGTATTGAPVRVHGRACVDLVAGTAKLVATEVKIGKTGGDQTTSSTTTTTTTTG